MTSTTTPADLFTYTLAAPDPGALIMSEARGWIGDCFGDDFADCLTDDEIMDGIVRHYDGGLFGFLVACEELL